MSRKRDQEIARYQKKLIPINIIVCILCVIATLSLYLMPIIRIDLGTIVGSDTVQEIAIKVATDKIKAYLDDAAGSEGGSGSSENGSENTDKTEALRSAVKLADDELSGEVPEETEPNGPGEGEEPDETPGNDENPNEGETPGENPGEGETPSGGNGSSGSDSSEISLKEILDQVDVDELVKSVVSQIMGAVKADISVSANNSLKVLLSQNKAETLLDELFFNQANGFIPEIQKTLIKGFGGAFAEAGNQLKKAIIGGVVMPAIKGNLPKQYADLVNEEDLQRAMDKFDNAKSAEEACKAVTDYIDELAKGSADFEEISPEQKAEIEKQITEYYNKTVEYTKDAEGNDNFSLEAMITVMASEAMGGVSDMFDLGSILAGMSGESSSEESYNENTVKLAKVLILSRIVLAEGEVEGEAPAEGEGNAGTEKTHTVYTSFRQMGEGLASSFMGENLAATARTEILKLVGGNDALFGYYGYISIGMAFFILLWVILFLFAFFHMLAKNKRFTMWYVKLFCFWPCFLFFVIPLLIMPILSIPSLAAFKDTALEAISGMFSGALGVEFTGEQATSLLKTVISAFKSSMWVSGACYIALWIVSFFAMPLKRKIKKLKNGYDV